MAKTRNKKINGKAPLSPSDGNSDLVLLQKGTEILRKGGRPREITKIVYTGKPRSKPYPYASARQGYGKAPRVETRSRPVLTVDGDTALHASR
jgi:hypothetical protein